MDLMDFNWDELLEVPLKWLETIADYLPEWPPSWLPDGPPDWLIDFVEKYAPYLPSAYFSDLFQFGLPHFYVQQNVCEKAFDIGVLILTFGTLIIIVLLLRRCLASEISRSKDRWICYECRAEKSEVLSEDLIHVEKRVDSMKNACQNVNKKLQGCLQGQGTDGPALEKRMKKLPEILLSNCMIESSAALGDSSVFGTILSLCGKVQKLLGNEILEYEVEVEKDVINKQLELLEVDIPNIVKQRKHLAKLTLDMDSAKTRYQTAARHSLQMSGTNAAKADVIKEEMDDASMKVEQCRDVLVSDMFTLISKETELAQHFVTLVKSQAEYHKKALNILDNYTNCMEEEIRNSHCRPVFGCLLEDHLKVTERHIALPLEVCICFLMEYGLTEEGLFRVAGSASKVKKLKAAFDANMYEILEMNDYIKDPHAVAGALKSYLRELPDPLMTHELYSEWIQSARISDTETRLQNLWSIVQKLPVPYFNNLRYIMKFLNKLSANQEVNKMTAQNLAIVIAPNLIWAPEDVSAALGMNMSLANMYSLIVDNLITHADWFFPGDVEFYLPSPLLRSPHDAHNFQSNPLHPPESDHQINGELDIHPSLLTVESNTSQFSQQSSQYGGSPKSLRRNKKPAPPAPLGLREKHSVPEKSSADKTINNENKLEKTTFEKNSVERKSSSLSDKERQIPLFASNKANHVDKNQINSIPGEKPQIPEKPNFDKMTTSPVDLSKPSMTSSPVPSERHHVEKAQMLPVDKNPLHNIHQSEESLPVIDESKNMIPEIVIPTVESESEEDESDEDTNIVPYHPHSPTPVDRFDYYRPDWYGLEQEESEQIKETPEKSKSDIIPPGFIYLKKTISLDETESKESNFVNESSVELEIKRNESLDKLESEFHESLDKINGNDEMVELSEKGNEEVHKTELTDAALSLVEVLPPSEEVIVIDQPPHIIRFLRPEDSKFVGDKEEKESAPKSPTISPDILGNLPFLSRKSPTVMNDQHDQISTILPSNVDEESVQNISRDFRLKDDNVPSSKETSIITSKEEISCDKTPTENLAFESSSADQKQAEANESREASSHYLKALHNFPSLSSRSESEMEYIFGDHSYTDSDRWSHSERSLSPDYVSAESPQQTQHHSLPAFSEHSVPDPTEEPMFEMSDWHSRRIQSVYQRPISPESTQSVPYSSPTKLTEDDYRNSSSSLPRKLTTVDNWFSTNVEPVARRRKTQRKSPTSSSHPKRPNLPPKIGGSKPKRPARPPQLSTRDIVDTHIEHSQVQETSLHQFDSRTSTFLPDGKLEQPKLIPEQQSENLQTKIRGSPAAPKRPPRPQPPPPPPPFKPRHNSSSEDTHL